MNRFLLSFFLIVLRLCVTAQENNIITEPLIRQQLEQAEKCGWSQSCAPFYQKALALTRKKNAAYLDLLLYKNCLFHLKNNQPDSAMRYANEGLSVPSSCIETKEILLQLKATLLYNSGKTDSAIVYFIKIANLLEQHNDKQKLAYTYTNIGNLLYAQENKIESLKYLHKAFDILYSIEDTVFLATTAGNIADGYYAISNRLKAKEWAEKTLSLKQYSKDRVGKIMAYKTLANLNSNKPDSAIVFLGKAIDIALDINDQSQLGNLYQLLAKYYFQNGNNKSALITIEKALTTHINSNFRQGLAESYWLAGKICTQLKQFPKATQYLLTAKQIDDSIHSANTIKIVNELNTKYQTEKKERLLAEQNFKIERARLRIRIVGITGIMLIFGLSVLMLQYRKTQKNRIKQIEQEKENAILKAQMNGEERERNRISKNLHDGVAAMIGAAKMSLQAMLYLPENKKDEVLKKVTQILDDSHTEVRRIAHDLLPITLQKEGLLVAIKQFVGDINEMGLLQLSIKEQLDRPLSLNQQTELMLYRIIQELVNNIIKHARAQIATIDIRLIGVELSIEVCDDGEGMEDTEENQGLFSIKERLKALGGSFNIEGKTNTGTKAKLIILLEQ